MSRIRGSSFARNVIWNFAGTTLPLIAGLVAIPILVRSLGVDRFGVLSIAWMAIGYFSLFDLGLGRALTHLVAEHLGGERESDIPELAGAGLLLMLLLGILAALIVIAFSPWLLRNVLHVHDSLYSDALDSFYLLAMSVPLVIVSTGIRGILEGYHRFDLSNRVRIPLGVFTFLGPMLTLPFSKNLAPAVAMLVLVRLVSMVVFINYCGKVVPELFKKMRLQHRYIRSLLGFGGWMTISNVVGPLMVYLDRFLIGMVLSVAAVSYYTVPYDLATRLWVIPTSLVGVMFPAASATFFSDHSRTVVLYEKTATYCFILLFPIVLAIVAFGKEGLALWLDANFASQSVFVLEYLSMAVFINCFGQIAFGLIQAGGRADITAKFHLLELPVYLAMLWWLLKSYGINGVAIAWLVRVIIDAVVLFGYVVILIPEAKKLTYKLVVGIFASLSLFSTIVLSDSVLPRIFMLAIYLIAFMFLVWFRLFGNDERIFFMDLLRGRGIR